MANLAARTARADAERDVLNRRSTLRSRHRLGMLIRDGGKTRARFEMHRMKLFGAILSGVLALQGCTLSPCLLDECDNTRRDVTGNWETDILGRWQARIGSNPTYMHEFGDGGAYTSIVLCDHGQYVQLGEQSDGFYNLDGDDLNIYSGDGGEPDGTSRPTYTIESITASEMSVQAYSTNIDGQVDSSRVVFQRVVCDL